MRTKNALLMLALSTQLDAQVLRSALFAAVGVDEYFGETYTESPQGNASYAFFVGEPIKMRITIGNEQAADLSLAQATNPLFRFALTANGATKEIELSCNIKPEATNVSGAASLTDRPALVEPLQKIEWVCPVDNRLPPGQYQLCVQTTLSDTDNRPVILRVASFNFEVRQAALGRAEIARRNALRWYTLGSARGPQVEAAIQQLLKIHPRSHEAHVIRGHVARRKGDEQDAQREYERAAEILERDEDDLLLKFKDRGSVGALRGRIRLLVNK